MSMPLSSTPNAISCRERYAKKRLDAGYMEKKRTSGWPVGDDMSAVRSA